MVKFFTDVPAVLDRYNPEAIPVEWYANPDSYDDEDEEDQKIRDGYVEEILHSYHDLPIVVSRIPNLKTLLPSGIDEDGDHEFHWYDDGKISRPGDNPSIIKAMGNLYSTLDENGDLHSYNGMPASFAVVGNSETYLLDWYEHGKLHRENDLPSTITFNNKGSVEVESYWYKGNPHRSSNLPCEITPDSETWMVKGVMHNAESYADAMYDMDVFQWALYGTRLSEEAFTQIRTLSDETRMPIWVAFLVSFRVISSDHVNVFMNSDKKWETDVPVSWILNCWNINKEMFESKVEELKNVDNATSRFYDFKKVKIHYESFMQVLKSEAKDAVGQATQVEGSHV